jgi:hypothetical protein
MLPRVLRGQAPVGSGVRAPGSHTAARPTSQVSTRTIGPSSRRPRNWPTSECRQPVDGGCVVSDRLRIGESSGLRLAGQLGSNECERLLGEIVGQFDHSAGCLDRSPTTTDAHARSSTIAELVTRRGYDTIHSTPHWFSPREQAVVASRSTLPAKRAAGSHADE